MNAVSGMLGLEDAAGRRRHLDDRLVEPVEQDREVVRREVADHAVGLVLAQVHPRRGDEVDLAQDVLADQVADLVDRRAVEERVARHQHQAAVASAISTRSTASAAVVASGFSTSTCLPASSAALTIAWCVCGGVATRTASICGSREHVVEVGLTRDARGTSAVNARGAPGVVLAQAAQLELGALDHVADEVRAPVAVAHHGHAKRLGVMPVLADDLRALARAAKSTMSDRMATRSPLSRSSCRSGRPPPRRWRSIWSASMPGRSAASRSARPAARPPAGCPAVAELRVGLGAVDRAPGSAPRSRCRCSSRCARSASRSSVRTTNRW